MRKIAVIAWKELYTTFRSRNLILIMFATPLALSTIIGLAFGSGGDSDTPNFADIAVAVVNLDEGIDLQEEFNLSEQIAGLDALPFDLNDVAPDLGGAVNGLGTLLESGSALNFGDQIAAILLSQPAATGTASGSPGFDFTEIGCNLLEDSDEASAASFSTEGTLDDLLDATAVADADAARAGVDNGEFAVAVIIPPGFSSGMMPRFSFDEGGRLRTQPVEEAGAVEVYANNGTPISARIVYSIVSGIVNQFVRLHVASSATLETAVNALLDNLDLSNLDLSGVGYARLPGRVAKYRIVGNRAAGLSGHAGGQQHQRHASGLWTGCRKRLSSRASSFRSAQRKRSSSRSLPEYLASSPYMKSAGSGRCNG